VDFEASMADQQAQNALGHLQVQQRLLRNFSTDLQGLLLHGTVNLMQVD
jgi:hypothetical protein